MLVGCKRQPLVCACSHHGGGGLLSCCFEQQVEKKQEMTGGAETAGDGLGRAIDEDYRQCQGDGGRMGKGG
eukprot:398981-Hanusia_phi.AAC.1